jgi:hypothetical protein
MREGRRSLEKTPPYLFGHGRRISAMVEILLMAQLVRNPLQAMARRWYCRGLFRATRGQRRCPESTAS